MPNTSLGYTATPANANLDALPQIAGILGALPANVVAALAAFNVVPVVASAAARDALIPAPVANMRVQRADSGFQERYDGAGWRAEGVLRSVGPVVATTSKAGFVGDGVNDDSVAMATADVAALASGGRHELDLSAAPTRVLVNSNLTLNAHFRPNPGAAKIYVGAGKTLTIAGGFDPGLHSVFDKTMPGNVVFTSKAIPRFYVQWFGVVGDGATNEQPALALMKASLPRHCEVFFSPYLQMVLGSNWSVYQLPYVRFVTAAWPVEGLGDVAAPTFIWGGAAHGTMITLDRCRYSGFEGFIFRAGVNGTVGSTGSADVCIDIDMIAAGGQISTQNFVRRNYFVLEENNPAWRGVRISNLTRSNAEYCHVEYNLFYGYGDRLLGGQFSAGFVDHKNWKASMTNGSNVVTLTTNRGAWSNVTAYVNGDTVTRSGAMYECGNANTGIDPATDFAHNGWAPLPTIQIGARVRLPGVGAAVVSGGYTNPARSGLDTVVTGLLDGAFTFTVQDNAQATSPAAGYWFYGRGVGMGLEVGLSSNAKGTRSRFNQFLWLDTGINDLGGNILSEFDNATGCDVLFTIGGSQSEGSLIMNANAENCRRFIINNNTTLAVTLKNIRTAPNWIDPVNGHFDLGTGAELVVEGGGIDSYFPTTLPTNCRLFDNRSNSGKLVTMGLTAPYTASELGWDLFHPASTYTHISWMDLTNIPGRRFFQVRGGNFAAGSDYGNWLFSGRQFPWLPADPSDDAQMAFLAPGAGASATLGGGHSTERQVGVAGIAATGIIERRTMRPDGTIGSAYLPVSTQDTPTSTAVYNIVSIDFGHRLVVDASAGDVQPQLQDAFLPVGFWMDIVRIDAGTNHICNIIANNASTINGIAGATGIYVFGKYSTIRIIKRAAQTYDAIPVGIMPIVAAAAAGITGLIANGGQGSMTLTVQGAVIGNRVEVDVSVDRQKLILQGDVSAANTVRIVGTNNTGAGVTLGACNVIARVHGYV